MSATNIKSILFQECLAMGGLDRARWRCMDQELFSLKAPNHCDVYDSKNEDEDATDLNGKYQGL